MRTRIVSVQNRLQCVLFVFVAAYLLCCGDIEMNPGPTGSTQQATTNDDMSRTEADTSAGTSRISAHSQDSLRIDDSSITGDVATHILEQL
ncbi:hypothetical protein ACOMHN_008193 [Nucella lapillus]